MFVLTVGKRLFGWPFKINEEFSGNLALRCLNMKNFTNFSQCCHVIRPFLAEGSSSDNTLSPAMHLEGFHEESLPAIAAWERPVSFVSGEMLFFKVKVRQEDGSIAAQIQSKHENYFRHAR